MANKTQPARKYITPEILSDLPVEDRPSDFHFEDFARTLARLIADRNTKTPLTIGVSGPWGSGKTTLLKRLQAQLAQTECLLPKNATRVEKLDFVNADENLQQTFRVCRTVWFNAWKYADEDELLIALVRVIVQRMWEDDLITRSLTALFEPFTPRRDVIDTVLGWFSIKTPFGEIKPSTGDPKPNEFDQKTALLDRFNDVLDRLLAAWIHQSLDRNKIEPEKGVLVVFIDDLDRCLPAKTVQVLEAIKLFLDRPGCVFVIGADTSLTAEAVQSYYDNAKVTGQKAGDYLEKIIQLRFELPPIVPATMQAYLEQQVVGDEMLAQWETLIAAAEVNPRRVKAVLNDINLQWSMLVNSGQAAQVRRADFVRWNALWRAAPPKFQQDIHDIGDSQLRYQFVCEALLWAQGQGDDRVKSQFQEYEPRDYRRLRDVMRKLMRLDFDEQALDAFIHLAALPERITPKDSTGAGEKGQPLDIRVQEMAVVGEGYVDVRSYQTWGGIEFAEVPEGRFLMGSRSDDDQAVDVEKPQHPLDLPAFWIARYPVTNAKYGNYAESVGKKTVADISKVKQDHPVVNITWSAAIAFCQWLNQAHGAELPPGMHFALPSEAEWEKAARGVFGKRYPWGDEFDPARCNSSESKIGSTTPVGKFSTSGDSPYGAADMAGNVWEWTRSLFMDYPYDPVDGREDLSAEGLRVLRGGAFLYEARFLRCAFRYGGSPNGGHNLIGFRVLVSPFS